MKTSVWAIVVNNKKEVLAFQRSETANNPNLWNFPGGGVEEGETAYKSILRELFEEGNIRRKDLQPLGKVIVRVTKNKEADAPEGSKKNRRLVFFFFKYNPAAGAAIRLNHESQYLTWLTKEQLGGVARNKRFHHNTRYALHSQKVRDRLQAIFGLKRAFKIGGSVGTIRRRKTFKETAAVSTAGANCRKTVIRAIIVKKNPKKPKVRLGQHAFKPTSPFKSKRVRRKGSALARFTEQAGSSFKEWDTFTYVGGPMKGDSGVLLEKDGHWAAYSYSLDYRVGTLIFDGKVVDIAFTDSMKAVSGNKAVKELVLKMIKEAGPGSKKIKRPASIKVLAKVEEAGNGQPVHQPVTKPASNAVDDHHVGSLIAYFLRVGLPVDGTPDKVDIRSFKLANDSRLHVTASGKRKVSLDGKKSWAFPESMSEMEEKAKLESILSWLISKGYIVGKKTQETASDPKSKIYVLEQTCIRDKVMGPVTLANGAKLQVLLNETTGFVYKYAETDKFTDISRDEAETLLRDYEFGETARKKK